MEQKNSNIGHNSNLLIEDAIKNDVREILVDACRSSKRASDMALNMWIKFSDLFKKESPLTKEQINWNLNVDKYNEWVMQQDPNPATNKKKLRKKYKPRKLTSDEAYDLYKQMDREFNELFDLSGDTIALCRGSENSELEQIAAEVDCEKN
jgi:hypothetical protein